MKFEADFIVFDDKADDDSISHEQGEVLVTLTKSRNSAKCDCDNDPNLEVILMFPTRQGNSGKMGVGALIDACMTGTLMKQSLFDLWKYKTVDELKAKKNDY